MRPQPFQHVHREHHVVIKQQHKWVYGLLYPVVKVQLAGFVALRSAVEDRSFVTGTQVDFLDAVPALPALCVAAHDSNINRAGVFFLCRHVPSRSTLAFGKAECLRIAKGNSAPEVRLAGAGAALFGPGAYPGAIYYVGRTVVTLTNFQVVPVVRTAIPETPVESVMKVQL